MKPLSRIICLLLFLVIFGSIFFLHFYRKHRLVGCWRATDSTIFIFNNDNTFIGSDFHGRKIWGLWVTLNKDQIGFQSLYHSGAYATQYAEVTKTGMRYANGHEADFIDSVQIDREAAIELVNKARLNQFIPKEAQQGAAANP